MNRAGRLQQLRRLVVGSLLPIAARGLGALASILLVYFLSSRLGAEQAGAFLWCVALTGVLATICRVGLDNVLVRRAALLGHEGQSQTLAGTVAAALLIIAPPLLLVVAALAGLPGLVAGARGHVEAAALLPWFALALAGNVLAVAASRLLIGLQRPVDGLMVEGVLLPGLFMLFALPVAVLAPLPAARLYALAALAALGVAALLLWRAWRAGPAGDVRAQARAMLASGVPLWMVMVMADVTVWGGMLVVGLLLPSREVALLAVAQRIASSVSLILQAVRAVVAPRFAALYTAGRRGELRRLAYASSLVNLAWATPLLLLVFLVPDRILALFGPGFGEARVVLLVLAAGQLVNAAVGNWGALLSMTGHEAQLRNITVATGLAALLLLPLATLAWGIVGAAAVMAATVALQTLITMRFGRRHVLREPEPQRT